MVVVSILAWLSIIWLVSKQKSLSDTQIAVLDLIKYGFGIFGFIGNGLIIKKVFEGLDREKIEKKIRRKIEKEYEK